MTPKSKTYVAIWVVTALFATVVATAKASDFGSRVSPRTTGRTWLYLEPEDISTDELNSRLEEASRQLTPRARARRAKTLGYPWVRACDLPPSSERLRAIEATGCRVVRVVRYVNAVVVEGSEQSIAYAEALSFVSEAKPVMKFASFSTRNDLASGFSNRSDSFQRQERTESPLSKTAPGLQERTKSPPSKNALNPADRGGSAVEIADNADYGQSLPQSLMVNIPDAHAEGYHGEGVLIGVQDTGFEIRRHRCYRTIDVIAAFDFLNGDGNVFDEDDLGSSQHGTRTLSVIAGLDTGNYIGAAPLAQFVLTKTENSESETPIEEDIWVEGLWFHDSLGVDVLSSSLSYRDWHDYPDYDGRTAVTSRAADSAFAAGVVIVNSMGNTGYNAYPENKLGAPADARGVISVGGVMRDSSRWQSSSQGPTYDGRIKPDVVAQSSLVYTASTSDNVSYAGRSGTSFSTPTVAGVVALVIQANPELTSQQVMDIMHRTSSRADSPDTLTGYGIVDALAAVMLAEEMEVAWEPSPEAHSLFALYPNPTNGKAMIFRLGLDNSPFELRDINGRMVEAEMTSGSIDLDGFPAGSYWIGSTRVGWRRLVLLK